MPVSERTYMQVVLEDSDNQWELACGQLIKKPVMTLEHNRAARRVVRQLYQRLSDDDYMIAETARLRVASGSYRIPDVCVVPVHLYAPMSEQPGTFEVYEEAVPFVAEVWSPSTGEYDVTDKLPEYRRRGDAEVWLHHPYHRTLTAWRRQPDGSYAELTRAGGAIALWALPQVTIDLDDVFR